MSGAVPENCQHHLPTSRTFGHSLHHAMPQKGQVQKTIDFLERPGNSFSPGLPKNGHFFNPTWAVGSHIICIHLSLSFSMLFHTICDQTGGLNSQRRNRPFLSGRPTKRPQQTNAITVPTILAQSQCVLHVWCKPKSPARSVSLRPAGPSRCTWDHPQR